MAEAVPSAPTTVLTIEHIVRTPGICGGRPRISGRRVKVSEIVLWHEKNHWSPQRIGAQFDLSLGQVFAALAYYHDHRTEIEQEIAEEESFAARHNP